MKLALGYQGIVLTQATTIKHHVLRTRLQGALGYNYGYAGSDALALTMR